MALYSKNYHHIDGKRRGDTHSAKKIINLLGEEILELNIYILLATKKKKKEKPKKNELPLPISTKSGRAGSVYIASHSILKGYACIKRLVREAIQNKPENRF